MKIKVVSECVECGGKSFTDLPEGSSAYRWKDSKDHPHCMCDECGTWFWQEAVVPEVRHAGPDAPKDGGYSVLFAELRKSKGIQKRQLMSYKKAAKALEEKIAEMEVSDGS